MEPMIKRSYKAYWAWNYDEEEQELNRMSGQGWQLCRGGCFHSKYIKAPGKNYIYKIDYNYGAAKNKALYLEMFAEQGWEYINSTFNGWNYFRKEDTGGPAEDYEIYTDPSSYNEMLMRWIRFVNFMSILFGILAVVYFSLFIIERQDSWIMTIFIYIVGIIFFRCGVSAMKRKMKE